ncbi:hypothetical protein N431DRAFT_449730 [Stipitochalara longipes BDJ]|nr:hypothetical protein N431DRAFT_449730 [Stipitochalara longipes BDJ]
MHLKHFLGLLPFLAIVPSANANWNLQLYRSPETNCNPGNDNINLVLTMMGDGRHVCEEVPAAHITSLHWNSGGSVEGDDSFFICFFNSNNCDPDSALATLPEGDIGCTQIGDIATVDQLFYSVHPSSDPTCFSD